MRKVTPIRGLFGLLLLALFAQPAFAERTNLRVQRADRRHRLGVKPMARANAVRWAVLRQRRIPYNEVANWTVKTLGFDADGATVFKALNKSTRESYFVKANRAGRHDSIREVQDPGKIKTPVLHTNRYREAFFEAAGLSDPNISPWRRKLTNMTTIAVTPKGESILAVTTPRDHTFPSTLVLARGSYKRNSKGKVKSVSVEILSDRQIQYLGLFAPKERQALATQHSHDARYKDVDGKVRESVMRGRNTSVKFFQRANKTVAQRDKWGSRVEIIPEGYEIQRWVNVLTGQETASNPRPIRLTERDLAAAYHQIFGE